MLKLSGKAVYRGIVLGKITVLKKKEHQIKREKITDAESEIKKLENAGKKHRNN